MFTKQTCPASRPCPGTLRLIAVSRLTVRKDQNHFLGLGGVGSQDLLGAVDTGLDIGTAIGLVAIGLDRIDGRFDVAQISTQANAVFIIMRIADNGNLVIAAGFFTENDLRKLRCSLTGTFDPAAGHAVGTVDNQNRMGVLCRGSGDLILGGHLKGNVKIISVCVFGRLVHGDQTVLRGHHFALIDDLSRFAAPRRKGAGGQQAQQHDQRQEGRKYTLQVLLLCQHHSFSPFFQRFENGIRGGRTGMAAKPL